MNLLHDRQRALARENALDVLTSSADLVVAPNGRAIKHRYGPTGLRIAEPFKDCTHTPEDLPAGRWCNKCRILVLSAT